MVPGAIHISVQNIDKAFAMDERMFEAVVGAEKPKVDEPVIFFCVKGIRAQIASDLLNDKILLNFHNRIACF